jgi:hypothetical protein
LWPPPPPPPALGVACFTVDESDLDADLYPSFDVVVVTLKTPGSEFPPILQDFWYRPLPSVIPDIGSEWSVTYFIAPFILAPPIFLGVCSSSETWNVIVCMLPRTIGFLAIEIDYDIAFDILDEVAFLVTLVMLGTVSFPVNPVPVSLPLLGKV